MRQDCIRDLDYFKANAIWHQAAHDMIGDMGPRGPAFPVFFFLLCTRVCTLRTYTRTHTHAHTHTHTHTHKHKRTHTCLICVTHRQHNVDGVKCKPHMYIDIYVSSQHGRSSPTTECVL